MIQIISFPLLIEWLIISFLFLLPLVIAYVFDCLDGKKNE